MQSLWSDRDAEGHATASAASDVRDLALRGSTSRPLGGDPSGPAWRRQHLRENHRASDLLGEPAEARQGQRPGYGRYRAAGLPAVRIKPSEHYAIAIRCPDEEIVRLQRANLLDPGAPNPR